MKNMRRHRDRRQPGYGKAENLGVAKKRRRTKLMSAGAHRLAKPDKNLLRAVSKTLPPRHNRRHEGFFRIMSRRVIASTALFALALSACTTVSVASNPIETRWVGHSAGEFFAKFSPPISDIDEGSTTVYTWRGGYNRIKQQGGRTASVSCTAKITVSSSYVIRDITIISDRPGANGPSYCTELLTAG
jgi:hypothetical protein